MPSDQPAKSAKSGVSAKSGTSGLMPVATALARLLDGLTPTTSSTVPLTEAAGRILATDLQAAVSLPPDDLSAMDGYAVRRSDCAPGAPLVRIGESAAGHPFSGAIQSGQTVRIFTGAIVPDGADAILLQEDADASGEEDGATVTPRETVGERQFIRPAGMDVSAGDIILKVGTRLSARAIALAISAGHTTACVWDRPRIGILSTGDELAVPGTPLQRGQIYSSNAAYLSQFVMLSGGIPVDLGTAADRPGAVLDHIRKADSPLDLIVTTGGASVGTHDHIAADLAGEITSAADNNGNDGDARMDFWKIAMRPGKPLIHGYVDKIPLLGLPGNPVSSAVCAMVFLRPALAKLSGHDDQPVTIAARLLGNLPKNDKRQDYLRATLTYDENGMAEIRPFPRQDSSMIGVFAAANALVVRPPFDASLHEGDMVQAMPLDPRL